MTAAKKKYEKMKRLRKRLRERLRDFVARIANVWWLWSTVWYFSQQDCDHLVHLLVIFVAGFV